MSNTSGKKVLMILASMNFRDPEFFEPKKVLEKAGIEVLTASSAPISKGAEGAKIEVDLLLDQVNPENFDAVAFIGGPGTSEYFKNPIAHGIAKKTLSSGKLLCAICIAPVILANAGVLKDKKATVFSSGQSDLEKNGATYTGTDIEIDGNIITATGPKVAKEFGEAIVKALK